MPESRDDRRGGAAVSLLFHALLVFLLVGPIAVADQRELVERVMAAKGEGPAGGGGGGGRRGTGGQPNQLTYVPVARPTPAPVPALVPPEVEPPKPEVTPPEPVKPDPIPSLPTLDIKLDMPPTSVAASSVVSGAGGGSGNDGSAGHGPGRGGGVGSGVGTGRGSGTGPGTGGGGGTLDYHPPTPRELFLPPLPAPKSVVGFKLIAEFDVDSTGRVVKLDFTRTKDKDFNKVLEERLRVMRFSPAVTLDGRPIRAPAQLIYVF